MLRAFRTTFLVAIDDQEADEKDDNCVPVPVTLEEFKQWIDKALRIDVDTEEHGNEIGFQSAEVDIENFVELEQTDVVKLYAPKPAVPDILAGG